MMIDDSRAARVAVAIRQDLSAGLEDLLPRVATHAETLALYGVVSVFWALVLYVALQYM